MAKQKPSAIIKVADGEGGIRPVTDHPFDGNAWLVEQDVSADLAGDWMAHLLAEIGERGWTSSGISQLDADQNSGSLSVHAGTGQAPPTLLVVWEKPRSGDFRVKVRPDDHPKTLDDIAQEFVNAVNARLRLETTKRAHQWDMLAYEGLAWRGELWLGDDIRLGPPSQFPDARIGPQIVIVDAMIDGIGNSGVRTTFQKLVRELRIFLASVLGVRATLVRPQCDWVAEFDEQRRPTTCELRSVGYWEVGPPRTFPNRNSCPPIARETVSRPGIGRIGVWPDQTERYVPDDIEELWAAYRSLSPEKKDNFLRAGNAYLNAGPMWPDQMTAFVVFHVVACEALKPRGNRYNDLNVYDVVASLVGIREAEQLHDLAVPPQRVRSKHVHRGELAAGELSSMLVHDVFGDPSFDEMISELSRICRTCLVEWLRAGGDYTVVQLSRP